MLSRRIRTLICMLVAAQAFLSAPVVAALASDAAAPSMAGMPCADMMPSPVDGEPCPCCPDGVENAAGCLSACLASLGAISTIAPLRAQTESSKAVATFAIPLAHAADPPLKPPPIR